MQEPNFLYQAVAESRYDSNKSTGNGVKPMFVQIRAPISEVMEGREKFKYKDLKNVNACVDFQNLNYQAHIFNGGTGDSYISDVPFSQIKPLIWFLHRNEGVRKELSQSQNQMSLVEFMNGINFVRRPGRIELDVAYEKYGLFDWIKDEGFTCKQTHRITLFCDFMDNLYSGDGFKNYLWNIYKVESMDDLLENQLNESALDRSMREAGSLITNMSKEKDFSGLCDYSRFSLCENHDFLVYWFSNGDQVHYKTIEETHPDKEKILKELEKDEVKVKDCPICTKN